MHGHCHMCGKCCEAIVLTDSPEMFERKRRQPEQPNDDYSFIAHHWREISREEAFNRNALHRYMSDNSVPIYEHAHFYECDAYDKETRLCTAHDKRPHVCSGYPFYSMSPDGTLPDQFIPYSPTCGFVHTMAPAVQQKWIAIAEELRQME